MYEFKGKWTDKIELYALRDFRNASGAYSGIVNQENTGKVNLIIMDEYTNDPDPKPAQIKAINFLIFNQTEILDHLLEHIYKNEYEKIRNIYQYEEEDKDRFTPDLNSKEDLKKLIGVGNIFIHVNEKKGIANIGFECGCTWDDEHGMGVVMNQTEVLRFGQADEAFSSGQHPPNYKHPDIPIKYKPHPKYGSLKPFQINANKNYEFDLISKKANDIFFSLVEKGEIDLDKRWHVNSSTLMERAISSRNYDIAKFLLSKGATFGASLHTSLRSQYKQEQMDFILSNGGDINDLDRSGNNLLFLRCKNLASLYFQKHQYLNRNQERLKDLDLKIDALKADIKALVKLGGKLDIKNKSGKDAYSTSRIITGDLKIEMDRFLKSLEPKASENLKEAKKPTKPKKGFWDFLKR